MKECFVSSDITNFGACLVCNGLYAKGARSSGSPGAARLRQSASHNFKLGKASAWFATGCRMCRGGDSRLAQRYVNHPRVQRGGAQLLELTHFDLHAFANRRYLFVQLLLIFHKQLLDVVRWKTQEEGAQRNPCLLLLRGRCGERDGLRVRSCRSTAVCIRGRGSLRRFAPCQPPSVGSQALLIALAPAVEVDQRALVHHNGGRQLLCGLHRAEDARRLDEHSKSLTSGDSRALSAPKQTSPS